MPPTASYDASHSALLDALASLRRKAKALGAIRGLGLMLATGTGCFLAIVLLDYLLDMPAGPRLVLCLAALATVGYVAWTRVVLPLASRLTLGDVAGRVETVFPQFDDRLRSTVDFITGEIPGSDMMKRRVIAEASRMAQGVDFSAVLAPRPAVAALTVGMGTLLLAVLLAAGNLELARTALSRLMMNPAQWPRKVQIDRDSLVNLPAKIASGQRIDIRMRLTRGDRASLRPIVCYRYDDGPVQQQIMTRGEDGGYSVGVDARGQRMSLWIKAGDDQIEPRNIEVVRRLAVIGVKARITPPAYARMEPSAVDLSEAPAHMTSGSNLELALSFNKPLADAPVRLEPVKADAKLPRIAWSRPEASQAVGAWTADQSLRFRVHATDADGFENPGLEEFEIVVRPDQDPSVIIENPRRNEDRTAVAVVPLQVLAEDDFELGSMTLVVDRLADRKQWEIPLANWRRAAGAGDRNRFHLQWQWELATLPEANLKPGDVLEYFVRVTDNYELNGSRHAPAQSGKLRIQIVSQETLSVQITDAIKAIGEKVRQVQSGQNRTRQETANLRQDTQDKVQLDAADRTALSRLSDQQGTIAAQTRQLAGQMNDIERRLEENRSENAELRDIARDVRGTLADTAENAMSEASRKLGEAAQKSDPKAARTAQEQQKLGQERSAALEVGENRQQEASDQLGKALEKMGNLGTFEQMLNQVRAALAQQQDLSRQLKEIGKETIGKRPDQLTDQQRRKLQELADAQRKASEKTDKLTQALDKAAEQSQKSDPAASSAMKQAAQQAQQQQVSSNQAQAAQSAQQNQQAQAQARQKQAELGLQMMLDSMREAERRKLEQLSRELAKLQELINNLVRRQSGHNIDNLRIQDKPQALQQITDDLLARAERIRDSQPPKPDIPQLGNSQIQTERNTRDVSKTAADLPKGGAEIAALLVRAAGHMERAIVAIKAPNLPEAYDPSQVKALAALEDARQKTEQAAQDVQKQIEDADKENIRQAYEAIKAEQEKINLATTQIDGAPRLPDGTFRREDAVKLGALPGQQAALADRTAKLEEALSALGGVVYVWANKDIVESMNQVKGDLAKPDTGQPVQIEEKRIVEQLDAMIRNLAVKPIARQFNDPPGGGGGGGACKPGLPSEAELRLLKELQIAVNKATRAMDALPDKEKPKLTALGGRQGELRNLLDTLLQKASRGQVKLDAEPDPDDRLPEEASAADIENQELDDWLRGARSGDDQLADDVKQVGQRMARSRQRLAINYDPGKTTQAIQERILKNLDNLIEMARRKQGQGGGMASGGQGGQAQQARNTGVQPQNTGQTPRGQTPRQGNERDTPTAQTNQDLSRDIREKASEWGHLTPRERQAVIEGTQEAIVERYKKLIEDYYEMMGRRGAEQR